jgi:hypothetical protein
MMRSVIGGLAAAVLLSCSFSASADLEPFKDYVPSKEVWNVTFVKVNPNRLDAYLEGLRQTWLNGCAAQKKAGTALDCYVYVSETIANRDFNVMLVVKAPSAGAGDPDEKRYNQVMADIRAKLAEDKEKQLVQGYDEMRTFFGEQSFRRLEFK